MLLVHLHHLHEGRKSSLRRLTRTKWNTYPWEGLTIDHLLAAARGSCRALRLDPDTGRCRALQSLLAPTGNTAWTKKTRSIHPWMETGNIVRATLVDLHP